MSDLRVFRWLSWVARAPRWAAVVLLVSAFVFHGPAIGAQEMPAAPPATAASAATPDQQVELSGATAAESQERVHMSDLADDKLVPPVSLDGIPFEFSIPIDRIASQTQVMFSWITGDRNADQGPAKVTIAELSQVYDFSLRIAKRWELGLSPFGSVAAGTSGESIVVAGGAASGGIRASAAVLLTPTAQRDQKGTPLPSSTRWSVLARLNASYEAGYRANIEPLLYLVGSNPLEVVGGGFNAAWVGTPVSGLTYGGGVGIAYAFSPTLALQGSLHLDRTESELEPWLVGQGSVASGVRELTYAGWTPSGGVALGIRVRRVLFQPQVGLSYHTESLTSETAVSTPEVSTTTIAPALQVMYLAGSILQLGGAVGGESSWTTLVDPYGNSYSTTTATVFGMLVARYIPGWH